AHDDGHDRARTSAAHAAQTHPHHARRNVEHLDAGAVHFQGGGDFLDQDASNLLFQISSVSGGGHYSLLLQRETGETACLFDIQAQLFDQRRNTVEDTRVAEALDKID